MFASAILLLILNIANVDIVHCTSKQTHPHLDNIKHYDLLHFNDPESFERTNIMQFDAFNQHYVVQLEVIQHLNPANIYHSNIDPLDHVSEEHGAYFTSLKRSCFYYGKVLNTNKSSSVVLSLCPKLGIRGHISAFDDTIFINPSAYYLDLEKEYHGVHQLTDEHLIYKASDLIDEQPQSNNDFINEDGDPIVSSRRRLQYNNGNQRIEIIVLSGPTRTQFYKKKFSNGWLERMISDTTSILAKAETPYTQASWDPKIGKIKLVFAEHVVADTFSGTFKSLKPAMRSQSPCYDDKCCSGSNINNYYSGRCSVDISNYLKQFKNWLRENKKGTFDNGVLLDLMPFQFNMKTRGRISGLASMRAMCSSNSANVNNDEWRFAEWIHDGKTMGHVSTWLTSDTVAHEIGHNIGMYHTAECSNGYWLGGNKYGCNSCSNEQTMMGNGKSIPDVKIDSCGKKEVLWFYNCDSINECGKREKGLKCLGEKNNNVGVDDRQDPPDDPPDPPSGGDDCITVSGASNDGANGNYNGQGTVNGASAYKKSNGYWLYRVPYNDVYSWVISKNKGTTSWGLGYCDGGTNVLDRCSSWGNGVKLKKCNGNDNGGDNGNNDDCEGESCIRIDFMTGNNGNWQEQGCDNNGRYYYKRNGKILCYSSRNRWIITQSLCSESERSAHCTSRSDDIIGKCQDNWKVKSGSGFENDDKVLINSCSGNAFTFDEGLGTDHKLDCFKKGYGDQVHMYSNGTLWNGMRKFEYYESLCSHRRPVYHYHNEKNDDGDYEELFFLHFVPDDDSRDDEIGTWVISSETLSEIGEAVCYEEELSDCTKKKWKVWRTSEDGDVMMQNSDEYLSVLYVSAGDDESKKKVNVVSILLLVIILIMIIIVGIGIAFGVYRNRKKGAKKIIIDESDQEMEETEDEEVIEIDVDGLVEGTTSSLN